MSVESQLSESLGELLGDRSIELHEQIQSLWSGYGQVVRVFSPKHNCHYVVKVIGTQQPQNHPRGWNSSKGHLRKVRSYEVETAFYQHYAEQTNSACKVPKLIAHTQTDFGRLLVLEDLDDAGFAVRKDEASATTLPLAVKWLAHFHALFMTKSADALWPIGTYWHLNTREDEWNKMADGPLKQHAREIAEQLNSAQFQTLVHGDAKFQNLCFHLDGTAVAAVDFQYVGQGAGVKDLVCLLAGCLTDEALFELHEQTVASYLTELKSALSEYQPNLDAGAICQEYQRLIPLAWADLHRFLLGWNPDSWKVTPFMERMSEHAINTMISNKGTRD